MKSPRQIVDQVLSEEDGRYVAKARLSVYGAHESPNSIQVPFRIELEYRSWGIKSAQIQLDPQPWKITIGFLPEGAEELDGDPILREIEINPAQLRLETEPGAALTVWEVELSLNEDKTVDYQRSSVRVGGFDS